MWNFKLLFGIVAVSVLGVASGCESERSKTLKRFTKGNIKKMAILYETYTGGNKFKGPEDEAQLREWLLSDACNKESLKKIHVYADKIDDYFISERTGEKFEVRWGVNSRPMGPPRPVIFEATAVDGIRQVGLAGGSQVLDVETDEEYDELMSGIYEPNDIERYPNRARKKRKKKKK